MEQKWEELFINANGGVGQTYLKMEVISYKAVWTNGESRGGVCIAIREEKEKKTRRGFTTLLVVPACPGRCATFPFLPFHIGGGPCMAVS